VVDPIRLLAIDPGERYTGYAEFHGFECVHLDTVDGQDNAIDLLTTRIVAGHYQQVACEAWRNYGEEAAWSEARTAEEVGWFRNLCRRACVPFVTQPAMILRPGRARMRAHHQEPPGMLDEIPAKIRVHAENAWVHGGWRLCELGLAPSASRQVR
jgi:hypothetical protein